MAKRAKPPTKASRNRTLKKAPETPTLEARTARWQDIFLDTLRKTLHVTKSAEAAGVARRTVYDAREADPEFHAAWDEALTEAIETAEGELYRRAVEGTLKPVYQRGKLVGGVREYSDTLLIFLLKSHKPDRYREVVKHETWEDDVLKALPTLTPEQRARVYAELAERGLGDKAQALFARVGLPVVVVENAG